MRTMSAAPEKAVQPPRVSVVIPAFNAARSIARAVDSCLRQTMSELEVLVVDDGSGDGTGAAVEHLAAGDDRVRLFSLLENGGVSRARNHGIDRARGEWIAILDADDHYHPDRLRRLIQVGEQCGADLVADNFVHYDPIAERILRPGIPKQAIPAGGVVDLESFLRHSLPRGLTRLSSNFGLLKPIFSREFLNDRRLRYQPDLALSEDYQFYLSCLAAGGRFRLLDEAYYFYHFNPLSASKFPRIEDLERISEANGRFLARADFQSRPRVLGLLREHQAYLEKNIAFHRLKAMVQGGQLSHIPFFMTKYGWALPYIVRRVAGRLLASR